MSKFIAGALAAALLIGGTAVASAQTESAPPLPPADDSTQQAAAAPAAPATASDMKLPPLPLGHNSIREVQTQLIALGFNPGPVDGELGPATTNAAEQYDKSRGGDGSVSIDAALLTRLQQDTGPRLTPEQVAARSQPRPVRVSTPLDDMMQQFGTTLQRLFNGH